MKKVLISVLGLFILSCIFFTACKKEETNSEPYTIEMNIDDAALEKQIKTFRDDMNSNLKSSKVMNVDDAIWMIEAAFNYKYTFTDLYYNDFVTDVASFEIEFNESKITSFSRVQDLYKQCDEFIIERFIAVEKNNKHVHTVMLQSIDEENVTNKLKLELIVITGVDGSSKKTSYFGSSDYWSFEEYAGKCGAYSGGTGSDAGNEIASEARSHLVPPGYVWSSYTYMWVWPNELPGSLQGSLINGVSYDYCVTYSNMNYYYDGLIDIINYYKPTGKNVKYCDLTPDLITGGSGPWGHYAYVIYAVRKVREDDPVNPGF